MQLLFSSNICAYLNNVDAIYAKQVFWVCMLPAIKEVLLIKYCVKNFYTVWGYTCYF